MKTTRALADASNVTKPQAVIAVATEHNNDMGELFENGYKTASGNRCCNRHQKMMDELKAKSLQNRKR